MNKNLKIRLTSLSLASILFVTSTGCSLKRNQNSLEDNLTSKISSITEENEKEEVTLSNYIQSASIYYNSDLENEDIESQYGQVGYDRLNIQIKDLDTQSSISGLEIAIRDSEGQVIEQFISNGAIHTILDFEYGKEYTIIEENTLDDYQNLTNGYTFMLPKPNSSEETTYNNVTLYKESKTYHQIRESQQKNLEDINFGLYTSIEFYQNYCEKELLTEDEYEELKDTFGKNKLNINLINILTGEAIEGGIYEIRDSKNNVVDVFKSNNKTHTIENLSYGIYTIIELVAPPGCAKEESPYIFEFSDTHLDDSCYILNIIDIVKEQNLVSSLENNHSNIRLVKSRI